MKNSHLIGILRTLDKKYLKKLHKFIQSPYFNESQKVLALLEHLMSFAPNYDSTNLENNQIFNKIYPDRDFEKNGGLPLRRLISQLSRLVEQFIELEQLERLEGITDKSFVTIQSFDFYNVHNLEKQYQKSVKQFKQKTDKNYPFKSIGRYFIHYQLSLAEHNFYSSRDREKSTAFLVEGLANLKCYYFLSQLQSKCLLLSLRRVIRLEDLKVEKDLKDLLYQVRQSEVWAIPLIQIYYHAVTILHDSNQHESFEVLKKLLVIHGETIPEFELRQLYVYVMNFCTTNKRKGKAAYNTALLELFQIVLEKGFIYADDKLLPNYFQAIVQTALYEKAFDWLSNFLEEHEHRILGDNPEQVFQFSLAAFAFARKAFDQATDLLITFDFTNQELKLQAKKLLIKIYYEMEEDDLLTSNLAALKVYNYRDKKVPLVQQERNKNFVNFLKRLMNTAPHDTKRKERLKKSLEEETNIAERKWLIKMLEGL